VIYPIADTIVIDASAWASASASASARVSEIASLAQAQVLHLAAMRGDWTAALAYGDFVQESEETMRPGDAVYIDGPLDITIGIVEAVDGCWVRMAPGCVTSRDVSDETELLATGKPPSGTTYAVHPRGRLVAMLAIIGVSPLPQFDTADWPPQA
jgi:hypothetical protein